MADRQDPDRIEVENQEDDPPSDEEEAAGTDDEIDVPAAERRVRKLSTSYRSQTGHLTRVIQLPIIHISEPTRLRRSPYAVLCLKKNTTLCEH